MSKYHIKALVASMLNDYTRTVYSILEDIYRIAASSKPVPIGYAPKKTPQVIVRYAVPVRAEIYLSGAKIGQVVERNLFEVIMFDKPYCTRILPEEICKVDFKPVYDDRINSWKTRYTSRIEDMFSDKSMEIFMHMPSITRPRIKVSIKLYYGSSKFTYIDFLEYRKNVRIVAWNRIKLYYDREDNILTISNTSRPLLELKEFIDSLTHIYAYLKGYVDGVYSILGLLEEHLDDERVYSVVRKYLEVKA